MTHYHFTGIKGSGMSSLALILHEWGHQIQGSDVQETYFTQTPLEERGIPMYVFGDDHLTKEMTLIAGNAFDDAHFELVRANQLNIPILRYHHLLGEMIKPFTSIAVSGTHGKTTTTGLLSHVLSHHQPINYLIGDGTGHGVMNSNYFAFEACEYKRHFLAYQPDYSIITNIEMDHPDYFKHTNDVVDAFSQFASQTKKAIIACGDDPNVRLLSTETATVLYGLEDSNDLVAKNITTSSISTCFDVYNQGDFIVSLSIPMFGLHNVKNALAVVAVLLLEGIPPISLSYAFSSFEGVKRRFTESFIGNNIVIDDYAHHPTEIRATMDAVKRKFPNKKIISVFQPHTFSRTKMFLSDFAESLSEADHVYICDIFGSARESSGDVSASALAQMIPNGKTISMHQIEELESFENAVLVFMGAGDIQKYEEAYFHLKTNIEIR